MSVLARALPVLLVALLARVLVSCGGYSGFNVPPMFGDYEAQRHWLEITSNLPPHEWYHNTSNNDLQYWGLDYPPLTAYHSYVLGKLALHVEPELVQLHTSRGYQSHASKWFMRCTVLVADLVVGRIAVFGACCVSCVLSPLLWWAAAAVVLEWCFVQLLTKIPATYSAATPLHGPPTGVCDCSVGTSVLHALDARL